MKGRIEKAVDDEIFNNDQVAKFLNVSVKTITDWRKFEKFPVHFLGSSPRYLKSEVVKWMLDRKQKPKKKTH